MKYLFCISLTIFMYTGCTTPAVKKGDMVKLAYRITEENGTRLDESSINNSTFKDLSCTNLFCFRAGYREVIAGWDNKIIGCETGRIYTFRLTPEEAYKDKPVYNDIRANTTLILSFKIKSINE